MNYTDNSTKGALYTLFLTPAGVDAAGEKLFTFASFVRVTLNDPTDGTPEVVMPISWDNIIADPFDNPPTFRIEVTNGGAIPLPQPSDVDQKSLHFVGPV